MGSSAESLCSQNGISGKRCVFQSPKLLHRFVTSLLSCGVFLLGVFHRGESWVQPAALHPSPITSPRHMYCPLHLTLPVLPVLDKNSYFKYIWSCPNHVYTCFISSCAPSAWRCICVVKEGKSEFYWNPLDSPVVRLTGQHVPGAFPNGQHWMLFSFWNPAKFSSSRRLYVLRDTWIILCYTACHIYAAWHIKHKVLSAKHFWLKN